MSDNTIILIPENAGFIPSEHKQTLALEKLRELTPDADKVEIEVTDKIKFDHCGGNFEKILCPVCHRDLEIKWWQEKMDEDFGSDSNFKLTPMNLPCCGTVKTLHELNYEFQQGFSKFSLSAMNPNIGEIPKEFVEAIETILDCKLRVIYRHI